MSLIAHWPLNGTLKDYSKYKHNGTNNGATLTDGGPLGKYYYFDGVNDTISFGTGNDYFPLHQFSISCWFKSGGTTETTGTAPSLFGFTYGVEMFIKSTCLAFVLYTQIDSTNYFCYLISSNSYNFYTDNKWHHVTMTNNSTKLFMYIDGILVCSKDIGYTWLGYTAWATDVWNIGRDNNNTNYYFKGGICDVRIYDEALNENEIKEIYQTKILHYTFNNEYEIPTSTQNKTIVRDSSRFRNNGIVELATSPTYGTNSNLGNGYFNFDGSTQQVSISTLNLSYPFTISFWCYCNENNVRDIFWGNYNNTPNINIERTTSNYLRIWINSDNIDIPISTFIINKNEWVHIVIKYELTGIKAYKNGIIVYTNSTNLTQVIYNSTFYLGKDTRTGATAFNGRISDFRIYSTALSDDDIKELYSKKFSLNYKGNFECDELSEYQSTTAFVQPSLTSNGVMWGDSFAVEADSVFSSVAGFEEYRSFDTTKYNTGYSWLADTSTATDATPHWYTFYNPLPIKISSISMKNRDALDGIITKFKFQGSNNNIQFYDLTSVLTNDVDTANGEWTIDLGTGFGYFKFHRFLIYRTTFTSRTTIGFPTINATVWDSSVNKISLPSTSVLQPATLIENSTKLDDSTVLLLHGNSLSNQSQNKIALINNGVTISDSGKFDKALSFNSTYLNLGNSSLGLCENYYWTIDWWEYRESIGTYCAVIGKASYNPKQGIIINNSNNANNNTTSYFYYSINGTNYLKSGMLMWPSSYNEWVHYAVVRNDENILCFKNGTLTATINVGHTLPYNDGTNFQLYRSGNSYSFVGKISEFRISNIARWTENFTPPTEPYTIEETASDIISTNFSHETGTFNTRELHEGI